MASSLPSFRTLLQPQRERAQVFWRGLSPQGQRAIGLGSALLLVLLVWGFVVAPLQQSRVRNAAKISTLRVALAEMQRDAAEVAQIRAMPPVTNANRALADVNQLQQVFAGASVSMPTQSSGTAFRVQLAKADWPTLTTQIATATARYRLQVARMALRREGAGAENAQLVSGEIVLADAPAR